MSVPPTARSIAFSRVLNRLVSAYWQSARWTLVTWTQLNGLGTGLRQKSIEISLKFRISREALQRPSES